MGPGQKNVLVDGGTVVLSITPDANATYGDGTLVVMTAQPELDGYKVDWENVLGKVGPQASVLMNQDASVVVRFYSGPYNPPPTKWVMPSPTPLPTPTAGPTPTPAASPTPRPPGATPLDVTFVSIVANESGIPVLTLKATNPSDLASDYFRVRICPKDSAGERIKRNGTGSECMVGQSNVLLNPLGDDAPDGYWYLWEGTYINADALVDDQWWFQVTIPKWTLDGFESATQVDFTVTLVHFVDGTSWGN